MDTKSLLALGATFVSIAVPVASAQAASDGTVAYETPPPAVSMKSLSASAASTTPISGTAYSSGAWYTSTNVRTVHSGANAIKVSFSNLPAGALAFYAKNYNTGRTIGSIGYFPPINQWVTLGSTSGGTSFVNVFKLQNTGKGKPYEFSGSESY